ncbi:alpha-galactosidase [Diaminobutyricimonas aerilata]|uniref:alpha-galactosidase n=1 Tax=Diaminobutyricimonas aerilata TaxID=1162967 RepID=A0A2M9CM18_9MICO|nr:alpha-galactosidase [Diaminobutyricimonas aerilata]PJJ72940.1 alpha-galactosidase [Diaminobutyricimonas aerilata]
MTFDPSRASATPPVHVLRAAGVGVVIALHQESLPEVVHWGADIGPLTEEEGRQLLLAVARPPSPSALDHPWPLTLVPGEHDGWEGRPGLAGHVDRRALLPRWRTTSVEGDESRLRVEAAADALRLVIELTLDESGVLKVQHELLNDGTEPVDLAILEQTMPVGDLASEVLDFSGRWTRERAPQRRPLTQGSVARESRRGRTGHDSPMVLALGTPGFGDQQGELWAVHLAWSGDSVYRVDALPEARTVIGAGALLRPGEITVEPGASFRTPAAMFVWSDEGLDGIGRRFHRFVRNRPQHPKRPRPVTLNTWEAVYFDHDLGKLTELARVAADIGVERFVLDDGWFLGRRDDTAGLGDWRVDPSVWPEGLHPLVDAVRSHGMEFGLWFEPEMVNLNSQLAREHPDWLLQPIENEVRPWRGQFVLDVSRPEVFDYLLESISALVTEYRLDYIKWDQNRDLIEAVNTGRANVHRHTSAVYDLLAALKQRHPGLEIESCASGGARVDLGILEHTDRVWASDTNDPVERLAIQRWTELLLPPELIGAHVGPPVAHTTKRATSLDFRIAVAMFGHFGIEWDITTCSSSELDELREGIAAYKRLRGLLHTGDVWHLPTGDSGTTATSIVAADGSGAVLRLARSESGPRALPALLRVPGLDGSSEFHLSALGVGEGAHSTPAESLSSAGAVRSTGSALGAVGVRMPLLHPSEAIVLNLEAR